MALEVVDASRREFAIDERNDSNASSAFIPIEYDPQHRLILAQDQIKGVLNACDGKAVSHQWGRIDSAACHQVEDVSVDPLAREALVFRRIVIHGHPRDCDVGQAAIIKICRLERLERRGSLPHAWKG